MPMPPLVVRILGLGGGAMPKELPPLLGGGAILNELLLRSGGGAMLKDE
jgi:hypothetical protein